MDKGYKYSVSFRDFSDSMIVSAPDQALEEFGRPKEESFPDAKYIWPFGYTRFHAFRLFTPKKRPIAAKAAFLCDNLFDLWLNGKKIAGDIKHLPLTDISEFLTDGENNLHIRG